MKTILKLSLVVLVAMTTISTYADNGDFSLRVMSGNGKEITFAINQLQRAHVTIKDKYDNVIYSETVTGKEGILKTYSLEEFPEGTYFLAVETNSKKVIHEIVVTTKGSTLSSKSVTEVQKPLKVKNQKVAAN
ncbi:DUF3244 domain-containing protein [Flavobacterium sp.]|uniref:DUF3244 domain-containing protein n=1 Tax=Flavobacterium sp. TaxID=239 RepID=UPI002BB18BD5|nr:DUF3244 domain-containing protein [Flavobacterium sp.]HSD05974.1 DUF3244 domain-containing protein [Flavobacterium sp.]